MHNIDKFLNKMIVLIGIIALLSLALSSAVAAVDVADAQQLEDAFAGTDDTIHLTASFTMNNEITVSRTVTLDLDGQTLSAAQGKRMFTVAAGAVFTITTTGNVGTLQGGALVSGNGGCIAVAEGGALRAEQVYFADFSTKNGYGGALYVDQNAASTLKQCSFKNCKAGGTQWWEGGMGGGIYIKAKGTATFEEISCENCEATYEGGGICNKGSLSCTDANVRLCTAETGGGIANDAEASLEATGVIIEGCSATAKGGGMYGYGAATNILNNCKIEGCSAPLGAGLYYLACSSPYHQLQLKGDTEIIGENDLMLAQAGTFVSIGVGSDFTGRVDNLSFDKPDMWRTQKVIESEDTSSHIGQFALSPVLKSNAFYLSDDGYNFVRLQKYHDTVLINFEDTANISNVYDNGTCVFAYPNKDIIVPFYLVGDDNAGHYQLGGYDVLLYVKNKAGNIVPLTNESVYDLLLWDGAKNATPDGKVASAYSGKNISIIAGAKDSFLNLTVKNAASADGYYDLYIAPNTVVGNKGTKSMFSGVLDNISNMTISKFDGLTFNSLNVFDGKPYLVARIYIKDLAKLVAFIAGDYGGRYVYDQQVPIVMLWERANATNESGTLMFANFDNEIPQGTEQVWKFDGLEENVSAENFGQIAENLTAYVHVLGRAPVTDERFSGILNLTVTIEGNTETYTNPFYIQRWLYNQTPENKFMNVSDGLRLVLNVSGAPVNTGEDDIHGWNTYTTFSNFTSLENYSTQEIPVISVKYYNGTKAVSSDEYKIVDEDGNETVKISSGIYIKNNNIKNINTTIRVEIDSYKLGDATLNKVINIADSSALGVDVLRDGKLFENTPNKMFGDIDHDTIISSVDIQNINKYLVGL